MKEIWKYRCTVSNPRDLERQITAMPEYGTVMQRLPEFKDFIAYNVRLMI
jgi:hypothetical protein